MILDYWPAIITGFFTLTAGPVFNMTKQFFEIRQKKISLMRSLTYEIKYTIVMIDSDPYLKKLLEGEKALISSGRLYSHFKNNQYKCFFTNRLADMHLLDAECFRKVLSHYYAAEHLYDLYDNRSVKMSEKSYADLFKHIRRRGVRAIESLTPKKWYEYFGIKAK